MRLHKRTLIRKPERWSSYYAFGFHICTNVELQLPRPKTQQVDLVIQLLGYEYLEQKMASQPKNYWLTIDTALGRTIVSADGRKVFFAPSEALSQSELQSFLLGIVMTQVLSLRQVICLHGGAVQVGDVAIGFVAPSGVGKSTLAASLMKYGCALLADDTLPIRVTQDAVWIIPSHPNLRLWDDTLKFLDIDPGLGTLAPYYDRKYTIVQLDCLGRFSEKTFPLHKLYLLKNNEPDALPLIGEQLKPANALLELSRNKIRPLVMTRQIHEMQFNLLATLAQQVDTRFLNLSRSLANLPAIMDAVIEDCSLPSKSTILDDYA